MDKKEIQNKLVGICEKIKPLKGCIEGAIADLQEKLKNEYRVIGLDIGVSSVKAVEMAMVDGKLTVVNAALVPIGGVPGEELEVLASIKTALVGMDVKGAKVCAVVNSPETCTRKIITPHMPKNELAEAIKWEAKNAIPFSIEDALMGFDIIGDVVDKGVKKLRVAVAATPKETVNRLVSLLEKAEVEVSVIIPMSVSFQNLVTASNEFKGKNIALVEIGAAITELNIFQDGALAFSRKLPIAGNDITKSLTSTLMSSEGKVELSVSEAEAVKVEHGIPVGGDDTAIDGKILPSQVLSLVRPCVEQLASEIERSFDFFREESHGQKVDQIVLFGGGASLKGLTKSLYDELEVEVVLGDAFKDVPVKITGKKKQIADPTRLNQAVGAAMNKSERINLAPVEVKEKTKRFIHQVSLKAVGVGLMTFFLLSYIGFNVSIAAQKKKLTALKLEEKAMIPQIERLRSAIIADYILSSHPSWEEILKEISNSIEPKMYLTELSMQNDELNFKGVVIKTNFGNQGTLSDFMVKLEDGIFRNVSLVTSKKESEDASLTDFELTAEVE